MAASPLAALREMVRVGGGVAWIVFVVAVAISGAGLALALDHPQTDAGRPELTARGDGLVAPRLAALHPALAELTAAVEDLATHAREASSHLRRRETAEVRSALAAGDASLVGVAVASSRVDAGRRALLDGTSIVALGETTRASVEHLDGALLAARQIPDAWAGIAGGATLPITVLDALTEHDRLVLAATEAARAADYKTAQTRLVEARGALDRARQTAVRAANAGRDATTLTDWIVRSANYDDALTGLYALLIQTGGTVTPEATAALAAVDRAKQALPKDTSALVIIVSDLGGGQVTLGLIELDRLRGAITLAAQP
ncbi:MAG: hypothetical protein QOH61_1955 [Chloroflexota bacterium]|jgi:hypothetical protein|nr:hypothetical protein [Chloroflexota bacterium]